MRENHPDSELNKGLNFFQTSVVCFAVLGIMFIGLEVYSIVPSSAQNEVAGAFSIFDFSDQWQNPVGAVKTVFNAPQNFLDKFYLAFTQVAVVSVDEDSLKENYDSFLAFLDATAQVYQQNSGAITAPALSGQELLAGAGDGVFAQMGQVKISSMAHKTMGENGDESSRVVKNSTAQYGLMKALLVNLAEFVNKQTANNQTAQFTPRVAGASVDQESDLSISAPPPTQNDDINLIINVDSIDIK